MDRNLIKSVLDEKKHKIKNRKPIGELPSVKSVFADPLLGVEADINEEGGYSDTLGQNDLPQVPKWGSGVNRGHANPIDFTKKWESGITRGKANSLFEGLNLSKKERFKMYDNVTMVESIDDLSVGDHGVIVDILFSGKDASDTIYKVFFDTFKEYEIQHDFLKSDNRITEGLNLVKKNVKKEKLFNYLDNLVNRVVKIEGINVGKNVFRLYSDNDSKEFICKCLIYPSGKFTLLQYRISVIREIEKKFKMDKKTMEHEFGEWFKQHYGDKIIMEGLNLAKKVPGPTTFPDNYINASLSHGTLNVGDLIPTIFSHLKHNKWSYEIQDKIDNLYNEWGLTFLNEDNDEAKSDIYNELYDLMNNLAPTGTSFTSHEGDGSDIGFWSYEDDEMEDGEYESLDITVEEALSVLRDGGEIMVKPYGDDYENYTGITIDDFGDETDNQILAYLREKDSIQVW